MQSHQIPDRPWSRVAADQFKLHGKDYIVIVDFYSDFIEVKMWEENTSSAVIEFLKEQFSRHSFPNILVTDNGPQFTSQEFKQFTHSWEFVHVSSSPHHHKSNDKVEAAVKVAKSLFKKALKDNKDPWLALLDQRNTPAELLGSSPGTEIDVPPHKNSSPNGHKSPISESSRKCRSATQAKKTVSQVLS